MLKIHHPFTLEGKNVILRPPLIENLIGLFNAAKDGEIWNNPFPFLPHSNEMSKYLQELLDDNLISYRYHLYQCINLLILLCCMIRKTVKTMLQLGQ
jgi:hypothetical protein